MARRKKVVKEVKQEELNPIEQVVNPAPPYFSLNFTDGVNPTHEIQIDWVEFTKLPEIMSKWLKKNGVDNRLILK